MDQQGSQNKAGGTAILSVSGMTCGGCANAVKRVLAEVPGVTEAAVDLAEGRATVKGGARPEDLVAAVEAAGFGARLSQD